MGLCSQIRNKGIQVKAHVWNTVNFILESMVQMKRFLALKGTREDMDKTQAIIIETFGRQSSSDATNNVLVRDKDSTFTSSGSF